MSIPQAISHRWLMECGIRYVAVRGATASASGSRHNFIRLTPCKNIFPCYRRGTDIKRKINKINKK